jgi:hypothetical protein
LLPTEEADYTFELISGRRKVVVAALSVGYALSKERVTRMRLPTSNE